MSVSGVSSGEGGVSESGYWTVSDIRDGLEQAVHVFPAYPGERPHDADEVAVDCWCNPEVEITCEHRRLVNHRREQ